MEQYFPPELIVGRILYLIVFIVFLCVVALYLIAWALVGKKCGYNPFWVALFMLIPGINTIFFFVMAFKKKPIRIFALKDLEVVGLNDRVLELEAKMEKKATPDKTGSECECPPGKCECPPGNCTCAEDDK